MIAIATIWLAAAAAESERPLSLFEAIECALRHDLDLEIARFEPRIVEQEIVSAWGAFDLVARASASSRDTRQPTASALVTGTGAPLEQQAIDYALGLRQTFPLGLSYDWSVTAGRTATNSTFALLDPRWDTAMTLAVSMPLLRGNARQLNAPLLLARRRYEASLRDFETAVADAVVRVETAYWTLHARQQEVRVREQSLEIARGVASYFRNRANAGLEPELQAVRAEADVAAREEALIAARNSREDAADELLRLVDPDALRRGEQVQFRLLDAPAEAPEDVRADDLLATKAEAARVLRSELASLRLQEEAQRASLEQARMAALPKLDLTASATAFGLDGKIDESFGVLLGDDFRDLQVGIALEIPWGNFTGRANRRRAELELERLAVRRRRLEDEVLLEIRRSVRALVTAEERIRAAETAAELARREYEAAVARREEGAASALDELQALDALETARLNLIQARVNYQIARAQLLRASGELLQDRGIVVEEQLEP